MTETEQKVAIITGGSQGIGSGLVEAYRQRGWAVVANSLSIKASKDPDIGPGRRLRAGHRRPDHQPGA